MFEYNHAVQRTRSTAPAPEPTDPAVARAELQRRARGRGVSLNALPASGAAWSGHSPLAYVALQDRSLITQRQMGMVGARGLGPSLYE